MWTKPPCVFVPVDGTRAKRLPDVIRNHRVGRARSRVGQSGRLAKGARVIVSHPSRNRHEQSNRSNCAAHEYGNRRPGFAGYNPAAQNDRYREADQHALVGAGGDEQGDADRHQHSVAESTGFEEPWHGSENEGCARDRERGAAGVGVDPIAEEADAQDGQHTAQQRPSWRQPRLQHPAERRTRESSGDQDSSPGMTEEHLAGSHDQTRAREVHGHIGGLHGDVDAF